MAAKRTSKQQSRTQAAKRQAKAQGGKQNKKRSANQPQSMKQEIFAGVCFFLGLFTALACFGVDGFFIRGLRFVVLGLCGTTGLYVLPFVSFVSFVILLLHNGKPVRLRVLSAFSVVFTVGAMAHVMSCSTDIAWGISMVKELFQGGVAGSTGGVLCGMFAMAFSALFNTVGAMIIFVIVTIIALLTSLNMTIISIINAIQNRPRVKHDTDDIQEEADRATKVVNHFANKHIEHVEQREIRKKKMEDYDIPVDDDVVPEKPEKKQTRLRQAKVQSPDQFIEAKRAQSAALITAVDEVPQDIPHYEGDGSDIEPTADNMEKAVENISEHPDEAVTTAQEQEGEFAENHAADFICSIPDMQEELTPLGDTAGGESFDGTAPQEEKLSRESVAQSAAEISTAIEQNLTQCQPEYCYPTIDLLNNTDGAMADGTNEMRENSERLNDTLQCYGIKAHICNVTRGPSVTRYEIELDRGVRLSKITGLADDIALSLGASGVRISAIPDKISVVGIEVPNRSVTTVSIREVVDSPTFARAKSKVSFSVGKDISGNCIVGDIAKLPHLLIAGTTGSGKSVCMNSLIISLLFKARPDEVKLIMVDPKMVELGIYNGIPHLLIPVVTDPKKAAGALQWTVTEMLRRYRMMSEVGVRDLESYNKIVETQEGLKKLERIVVVIDELADLMLVAAKEVEESICRIAQMGRASGIHLVIATQRPSSNVITGLMKANIPSRIAFAVASAMESRIILDTQGAEKLVGRGDMLFAPQGKGKPKRIQGCFITDSEVERVVSFVKNRSVPNYAQDVIDEIEREVAQGNKHSNTGAETPMEIENTGDELLPAAVEIILETGQASVSMLQRRLKLGYARAARIVDEMEEKGIVGPFVGSKPRQLLITKEQWQQMQSGEMMTADPVIELQEE